MSGSKNFSNNEEKLWSYLWLPERRFTIPEKCIGHERPSKDTCRTAQSVMCEASLRLSSCKRIKKKLNIYVSVSAAQNMLKQRVTIQLKNPKLLHPRVFCTNKFAYNELEHTCSTPTCSCVVFYFRTKRNFIWMDPMDWPTTWEIYDTKKDPHFTSDGG